jgi:hypothetical protein
LRANRDSIAGDPRSKYGFDAVSRLERCANAGASRRAKKRNAANQAIYKQMGDKQTAINNLITSGSNDALQVSQLTLDINNLRKQLLTRERRSTTRRLQC